MCWSPYPCVCHAGLHLLLLLLQLLRPESASRCSTG